jgi:hypothetical protein
LCHPDRALESALAYHHFVARGLSGSHDHLRAAALASNNADAEFHRAACADTAADRRVFLDSANRARALRNGHRLAADVCAIGEGIEEHTDQQAGAADT